MKIRSLLILSGLMALLLFSGYAQDIPEHPSNTAIYQFLDEMASQKLIKTDDVMKPWSRQEIADYLLQTEQKRVELNSRQKADLDFYLREYAIEASRPILAKRDFRLFHRDSLLNIKLNSPGLYYNDGFFSLAIKLIAGYRIVKNEADMMKHRYIGGEARATIGKHWGFWTNLRDNNQSIAMALPGYFTTETGGMYKGDHGATDFSEMRGGMTYSWKWGSFGLMKDHFVWGTNIHGSNILSGRTPSFPYINLKLHPVSWLKFQYVHAWLVSEVVDSLRSYQISTGYRKILRNKYLAANMFTISPFKYLDLSIGNSVIYSDINVHPVYFIPFLFYKSVDHTIFATDNFAGQNAQMFFNINSRNIKHLQLFTSVFVDEISFSRMWDKEEHSNFVSMKAGMKLRNWPLQNIWFAAEYTRTNPLVYQHFIPTLPFESNLFSLGHYLGDNSDEIYLELGVRPLRGLDLSVAYTKARHGDNYKYGVGSAFGRPFLENITWSKDQTEFNIRYELVPGAFVYARYMISMIEDTWYMRTPEFLRGDHSNLEIGANIGF